MTLKTVKEIADETAVKFISEHTRLPIDGEEFKVLVHALLDFRSAILEMNHRYFYVVYNIAGDFANFYKTNKSEKTIDVREAGLFTIEDIAEFRNDPDIVFIPYENLDLDQYGLTVVPFERIKQMEKL